MNVKDCTVMPPTTPVHPTPILLIAVMPSSCRLSDKNVMKHRDLNSAKTLTVIGLPSRSSNTDAKKRLWNPGRHTCGDPQTSTYRSYTYTFKPFSIVTTSNKILCDPMASYVILCPVFKDKSWPPQLLFMVPTEHLSTPTFEGLEPGPRGLPICSSNTAVIKLDL